jgi:hypothetical protein
MPLWGWSSYLFHVPTSMFVFDDLITPCLC